MLWKQQNSPSTSLSNQRNALQAEIRTFSAVEMYVITELCANGCLRDYLFNSRDRFEKSSEPSGVLSQRPSNDGSCVSNPTYKADAALRHSPR